MPASIYSSSSSRTNKKERLENCASLVSPGWKPDRKVAETEWWNPESGGFAGPPVARYFYALNFRVVPRREFAMLIRKKNKKAKIVDQNTF